MFFKIQNFDFTFIQLISALQTSSSTIEFGLTDVEL